MAASKQWTPIFPVPTGTPAPRFTHSHRGEAQEHFHIRDADGSTLGYVCVFFRSTGEPIEQTLTWCINEAGERAWRYVQFPKLRPLYGLDEIEAHPERTVLLTFSCRAAAAARALDVMPLSVAMSWPGGVSKIDDVHWSPLRGRVVYICPDAGKPKAAKRIAKILTGFGCTCAFVDVDRDPLPPGWNLADALAAKWTAGNAMLWLTERLQSGSEKKKQRPRLYRSRPNLDRRATPNPSANFRPSIGATASCRGSSMRPRMHYSRVPCPYFSARACWCAS